jgi:serine/threonine protein kinase
VRKTLEIRANLSMLKRKNFTFIFRLRDEKSAVKTLWPVACREFLFLPEYKVKNGELEENFEIITFIAKGAFGSVYKVRKLKDSKTFALKVLEKSKVDNCL